MDIEPKWFWAHVQMMPRVEAQEALGAISQIAAGNGLMDKSDAKQYLDQLRRAANGGRMPRAEKATAASLAMIGIKVVTEESEPADHPLLAAAAAVQVEQQEHDRALPEDPRRARVQQMAEESDRKLEQIDHEMDELTKA